MLKRIGPFVAAPLCAPAAMAQQPAPSMSTAWRSITSTRGPASPMPRPRCAGRPDANYETVGQSVYGEYPRTLARSAASRRKRRLLRRGRPRCQSGQPAPAQPDRAVPAGRPAGRRPASSGQPSGGQPGGGQPGAARGPAGPATQLTRGPRSAEGHGQPSISLRHRHSIGPYRKRRSSQRHRTMRPASRSAGEEATTRARSLSSSSPVRTNGRGERLAASHRSSAAAWRRSSSSTSSIRTRMTIRRRSRSSRSRCP